MKEQNSLLSKMGAKAFHPVLSDISAAIGGKHGMLLPEIMMRLLGHLF